jgi:hypothetical protein
MANDSVFIDNALTNEIIVQELSDEEQSKLDANRLLAKQIAEQEKTELLVKKEAALGKLAALGLTAEDLKALGL